MRFCGWLLRGLGIVGLVLGGDRIGCRGRVASRRRAPMRRPSRSARSSSKATSGSKPRPSAPISGRAGRPPRRLQIDEGVKALYATGLFQDVRTEQCRRPADRHGGRKPGDQPDRLRGQQEGQGRAAQGRNPVEGARHAFASGGAGRRAAPGRSLPAQRPVRRPRRAEDHRAAEQPRRSRVRDQRGRQDRRQEASSSSATGPIPTTASRT